VRKPVLVAFASLIFAQWLAGLWSHGIPDNRGNFTWCRTVRSARYLAIGLLKRGCPRPSPGSAVPEPFDLRSHNGVLEVDLTIQNDTEADGSTRYCYIDGNGHQSPNLRLKPGDLLILHLKDDLKDSDLPGTQENHRHAQMDADLNADPCARGSMTSTATNLHFHGLTVPPVCHQDDVLKTSISPGDPPFEYRFRIPANEPPGLYWYHPHIHGFTKTQVLGGASGAMIVEGIERANKVVAGLPERVLIIRDRDLLNPNAPPSRSEPVVPKMLIDRDGDAANNGTGSGSRRRIYRSILCLFRIPIIRPL
jgi:FtsP/CotA-like multicopper oxidase with cupredoxin domain